MLVRGRIVTQELAVWVPDALSILVTGTVLKRRTHLPLKLLAARETQYARALVKTQMQPD